MKNKIVETIGPVQCERHDQESGEIVYEIWDYNKESYHRICVLSETASDCALVDAKLIVKALNKILGYEDDLQTDLEKRLSGLK